ncbi:MAG: TetR family transcriptional regulator [Ahniella sp.]|nr:TetR family transcriptional regulator [Ahniella sp.]
MTRPPKARLKILQAARRIVESRGAGHLTFEELAVESGVTRGGITYHFPTKEALLKGLIEADLVDWDQSAAEMAGACPCPRTADVIGQIRCNLDTKDEGHKRFVTGMISASMVDPSLLDPVREHHRRKFEHWTWDEAELKRYVLLLATEGLFWQDFFNLDPLKPEIKARVVSLIEQLVQDPGLMSPKSD